MSAKPMVTRVAAGDSDGIREAAAILRDGGLVGIPTETVYGLAANAFDELAVRRIFEAKGRPQDNPLIVHIAEFAELRELVSDIPAMVYELADAFWPGPLTMVLPKSKRIPHAVSAGLSTVAVRMPSHPLARAIIKAAGVPLAAPSANVSGSPSPTSAAHVLHDLDGRIPLIIDGGESAVGVESTVVDMTGDVPYVLRPGGITPEMIAAVAGSVRIHEAVTAQLSQGAAATSPGMKYKHYAPHTHLVLVEGSAAAFAQFVNGEAAKGEQAVAAMTFAGEEPLLTVPFITYGLRNDTAAQAQQVFDVLRRLDDFHADIVYCACPSRQGVGLAVYNRLLRAAAFEVISVD